MRTAGILQKILINGVTVILIAWIWTVRQGDAFRAESRHGLFVFEEVFLAWNSDTCTS